MVRFKRKGSISGESGDPKGAHNLGGTEHSGGHVDRDENGNCRLAETNGFTWSAGYAWGDSYAWSSSYAWSRPPYLSTTGLRRSE